MFTRDSLVWWVGIIAAVVVGIGTLGTTATEYGIPVSWLPYIRLAALVMGIVSGKLATSPLPHSEEGDAKITDSGK